MVKNFSTFIISIFLALFISYSLLFLIVHFDEYENNQSIFQSVDKLQFHQKYSKKLHHLRDVNRWEFDPNKNPFKKENYLFTTINHFSNESKNILIQGDSFVEGFVFTKSSYNLFKNFSKKNNFGLVISGVTSYSPSLMKLQYEILKKDFKIQPNIVVAYIDQSDIGDELCRYKNKSAYDDENNLISIKNENYTRAAYDYTKVYRFSEIVLSSKSKIIKNFEMSNFHIKYFFLRAFKKYKSIKTYGWKNRNVSKCRYRDIAKYLIKINDSEISFFNQRVKDYLNLLLKDEKVEKIILVTHPHIGHLYGYKTPEKEKKYFTTDVSDIIDKLVKDEKKIYFLNFSKLIKDGRIDIKNSPFKGTFSGNQWDSHFVEEYQTKIFASEIINLFK